MTLNALASSVLSRTASAFSRLVTVGRATRNRHGSNAQDPARSRIKERKLRFLTARTSQLKNFFERRRLGGRFIFPDRAFPDRFELDAGGIDRTARNPANHRRHNYRGSDPYVRFFGRRLQAIRAAAGNIRLARLPNCVPIGAVPIDS